MRVPAMIWSPILKLNAPTISDKLFHISDWLPTLLSSARIDFNRGDFDGVDHWSEFTNDPKGSEFVRTQLLVNIDPVEGWSSVIKDDFKLVNKTVRDRMDDWLNMANVDTNLTDQTYVQLVMQSEVFHAVDSILTEDDILKGVRRSIISCSKPPGPDHPLFCGDSKTVCLFNIMEDPCEFFDHAEKYPEIVERLSTLLQEYEKSMVPPLNKPSDERSDPIHHNGTWVSWDDVEALTYCQ